MADSLLLDGLELNDLTTFGVLVDGLQMPPPAARPEWIGAADSEAQLLARTPLHENRTVTIPVAILQQATVDLVFDKIGQLRDKLKKAAEYQDGITLAWTAHGSSRTINFDVLSGEFPDIPLDWESGFQSKSPTVPIVLTCKPYWRGTETLTSTTSSSTPFVSAEIANSSGDIPALGRLIITDTATQSRRHVEWGLEGPLTYNSSTSLLIDSDNMVTSGFGGTQTTQSGAYDPNASGNSVVGITARTAVATVAGVGDLSHVGAFRVKGRVYSDASTVSVRLAWKAADGPMVANSWATHRGGSAWQELDLGTIIVPAVISGTQRWTGQVEVKTSTSTATVRLDYLALVPTTVGYGKARGVYTYTAGALTGLDDFTSTTAGSALNARVATLGGTWATSGSATDFAFADDLSGEQVKRTTTSDASPRFGVLGSTAYFDSQVSAVVRINSVPASSTVDAGVVARWVDSSNYLRAFVSRTSTTTVTVTLGQVVAGAATTLGSTSFTASQFKWWTLRLLAFASGRALFYVFSDAGDTLASIDASSTALGAGGALDDGKPGIYDVNNSATAVTRYYDDFQTATPPAEPIVIYSGRNMQIRHDDTIRQDSTGTYTGRPASYRGTRFLVPVGTSRVMVKARRNDVDTAADDNVTDATQIQVGITPRGLAVPR